MWSVYCYNYADHCLLFQIIQSRTMWRGIWLLPFSYIQKVEEILDVNFLLVVLIFAGGFLVAAICCILVFRNRNTTKMIGEYKFSRFAGTFLWALLAVILIVHRITGIAGDFIFYVVVSAGRKFSHSKKA